jgi:hypothetical protein
MSSHSTSQTDETRPLLASPVASSEAQDQGDDGVSARLTSRIYVSHFLSTWNTRTFEFGSVLYLATIFPGTLLPMSVYALTRGLSAMLLAPAVGQYIDTSNRLQVVRLSIGEQHCTQLLVWKAKFLPSFTALGRCGILCPLLHIGHQTENASWHKGGPPTRTAGYLCLC